MLLPITLPGIVTGMALNATFTQVLGVDLTLFTVIVGHATFCIVVVYNNAVARLRRTGTSLEDAASDLGAGSWQTFRDITFPQLRSALVAGALLAFALSFDEIIVTTFTAGSEQTLPIWIFTNYSRPNQLPIVNVVSLGDPALDHPRLPRQPAVSGPGRSARRARGGGRRPIALRAAEKSEQGQRGADDRLRTCQAKDVRVLGQIGAERERAGHAVLAHSPRLTQARQRREPVRGSPGGRGAPERADGLAAGVPHLVHGAAWDLEDVAADSTRSTPSTLVDSRPSSTSKRSS